SRRITMSTRSMALLTVLLGAASASVAPMTAVAQDQADGEAVEVVAQNRASDHVRVYVRQGGHMVPLGLVEGSAEKTWTLAPTFVESGDAVHVLAEPLGGSEWYESEPLSLRPRSRIALTIEQDIRRSSAEIRS